MDIFAHGLWTAAIAKTANRSEPNRLKVWLAVFWGIFPDLFAFTLPVIWMLINLVAGTFHFSQLPRLEAVEPPAQDTIWIFRVTPVLYSLSHSLLIFAAVFSIVRLILRHPAWEMGGWMLHILIDIPTHSYKFYPTPFLWPASSWKFDGISWSAFWFMLVNYSAIILIYILLKKRKNRG